MHWWSIRFARLVPISFFILSLFLVASSWAQEPLLQDDFNDNSIDTDLWKVTRPYSNSPQSTAVEGGGHLELFRRGIIDSVGSFPEQLDIEGRFRFVGDNDTLSIVFRSDLSTTNLFERRGVQAALQQTTGRVFLIPDPFASTPIQGAFIIGKNTDTSFRVTDNGSTVRLYLENFLQPVLSATITNRRGNKLSIYNLNGTTSRTRIDQFAVYPLQTSVFIDGSLVRTGLVQKSTSALINFQSIYTNSSIYYTLDGSTPSFVSSEYRGQFELTSSATIRAISYTSDFLASSESIPIEFRYLPVVRLTNETRGGDIVTFYPPGPYLSNQVVTLNALPGPGWQFLRWEGAASGTTVSNQITMTNHLGVRAVFGTIPAFTIIGSGRVQTYPAGTVFEYGTTLRLMAIPDEGSYFFRWANALAGSVSPGTLIVSNATPSVTALFAALAANQSSLTLRVDGAGTARVSPAANVFTNGQSAIVTALPDIDQIFLGWTGSSGGKTNPLVLVMNGNQTITARFAPGVKFNVAASRFGTNGFLLFMKGVPGFSFDLQQSSNLLDWSMAETLTNVTGELLYQHREATNQPQLFYRIVAP